MNTRKVFGYGTRNLIRATAIMLALIFTALSLTGCPPEPSPDPTEVPPEQLPVEERWYKWIADDATATLDYSVDADGVCTITIGGTAQVNNQTDGWGRWKANALYNYTPKANTAYAYTFEAWTKSGNRELAFQYFYDHDANPGYGFSKGISITAARTTYTIYGQAIPKDGIRQLEFQSADQLGTFYVKVLEITQ